MRAPGHEHAALANAARRLLDANRRCATSTWDGKSYDYTCPSPSTYPFQWAWDSAFHAIALVHVDVARAERELATLLSAATQDGFLPHMVLWTDAFREQATREFRIVLAHPFHTATIQPPVIARAIERVYAAGANHAWLDRVLPLAVRFFDWLARHRATDDGLITIIQPDESGLDISPKYDVLMGTTHERPHEILDTWHASMARLFADYDRATNGKRHENSNLRPANHFVWKDVLVNAIYGDGLRALARLTRKRPCDGADSAAFEQRADRVTHSLVEKCWDEARGVFWDVHGADDRASKVLTSTCLLPLILRDLDPAKVKRLVEEHLLDENEFWLPYPVPSVAANEPSFEADFASGAIFRGPTWVHINWYLYWGLRDHGYTEVADELARRTALMVREGGLRECYDPYRATGYGALDFGWSTLVLDLLAQA